MSAPTDVVITWGMSGIKDAWKTVFTRPTKFITLPTPEGQHYGTQASGFGPNPVRKILLDNGINHPLRVAVCGFSESCQGVRALVASADAPIIEHAIFIDGIHCSWVGDAPNNDHSNIAPSCLGPIVAYADLASRGPIAVAGLPPSRRYCTITHSSIVPTFPSTTDTARAILNKLFASGWPKAGVPAGIAGEIYDPPKVIQGTSYSATTFDHSYGQMGLAVMGYKNASADGKADHIFQGSVVYPMVLAKFLAPRWNNVDPTIPGCNAVVVSSAQADQAPSYVGSSQCNSDVPLVVPDDTSLGSGKLDWQKYYGKDQPAQASLTPWWVTALQITGGVLTGFTVAVAGYKGFKYLKANRYL